ncbi:SnoaL-like domain-containing protein [Spongiivirga sp. MCCC 1A20706]|uniref:SnoaL-like domain-containing protein n=1 Tax=Spongiivirga sp. MCCC 1A20706 TaxID=3160963 RepID=UPI003977656F
MTTKEVADRLVSLCREGKYEEAYNELYAENCISQEMPGMPNALAEGKEQIIKDFHQWQNNIQEMHGGEVGDPMVAGNHFAIPMSYDITFKEGGRQAMEEICMYQVQNGQITKASYHYEVPEMG